LSVWWSSTPSITGSTFIEAVRQPALRWVPASTVTTIRISE
jgi:hypothetical protein